MDFERILHIPNRISVLHHVRRGVSYFINKNIDPIWENRIILAIDEALSNIIQHGYTNNLKDSIKLSLSRDTNGFLFIIEDNAKSFSGIDEKSKSDGYGLILIESVMRVERIPKVGGNILILKKKFSDMK